MKKFVQSGFTLVELLIVVIILAILAAIVVPQFSSSTDDARVSSLQSTLAGVRSALALYNQQHGRYPSAIAATGGGDCAAGTVGAGAANSVTAFNEQMTMYTKPVGAACSQRNTDKFTLGPYLKETLPGDPITAVATLTIITTGDLVMDAGASVTGGWKYDNVTGRIIMNHVDYDQY